MSDCLGPLGNELRVELEPNFSTFERGIDDNKANSQLCVRNTSVQDAKECKSHVSHPAVYVYIDTKPT